MPTRGNKDHLQWCLSKDNGIRFVAPSDKLVTAYREKSKTALKSMEVNITPSLWKWISKR